MIGAGWPLMTNDLKKAGMNVKEVLPKEGVTGWSDSWMLSKNAKHPICAYKYMNYVTLADDAGQGRGRDGLQPREPEDLRSRRSERCKDLHITRRRTTTTRSSTGQTPVQPTNYRQWTDAWAEVKG